VRSGVSSIDFVSYVKRRGIGSPRTARRSDGDSSWFVANFAVARQRQVRGRSAEWLPPVVIKTHVVKARVGEIQRRPQKAQLRDALARCARKRFTDRTHAPGPVLRPVRTGFDVDSTMRCFDPALPRTELGGSRHVEKYSRAVKHCLARFFERFGSERVEKIRTNPSLGSVHDDPVDAQGLNNLDAQRTNGRAASVELVTSKDRVLAITRRDAERPVRHSTVGVQTHRDREVVILGVPVEPEAVVGVGMPVHDVSQR
jgi:hypothetical protein